MADKQAEKTDNTPVPTQAQLDDLSGGKDRKVEKREAKPAEDMTPTPTQAEADKIKAALFNTTVEADKKLRDEYALEHKPTTKAATPEEMIPAPTQAENDAAKKAAVFEPEDAPGGGTDPQKRKAMEAEKPTGGYQTRSVPREPAPAKAE